MTTTATVNESRMHANAAVLSDRRNIRSSAADERKPMICASTGGPLRDSSAISVFNKTSILRLVSLYTGGICSINNV